MSIEKCTPFTGKSDLSRIVNNSWMWREPRKQTEYNDRIDRYVEILKKNTQKMKHDLHKNILAWFLQVVYLQKYAKGCVFFFIECFKTL